MYRFFRTRDVVKEKMKRTQRLKSAQSWLQTYDGEPKKIVKAYRKKYGVDWPTAFLELEMLGLEIDPSYKEQVLLTIQRQAEIKKQKKAEKEREIRGYDQDDHFAMIIGYTSGGAPYGVTWEEWKELNGDD